MTSLTRRAALGSLAAGLGLAALSSRASADSPPLRIGVGGADTYAEGFYASDMGFFTKAGLNVTLSDLGSGGNLATAVAANALDIGMSNTVNLANAIAHGAPFALIAGAGLYTASRPTVALAVALNSPLRAPKELAGKTIAVTALKDTTEVGARAWLEQSGVDAKTVRFVELSMGQMPAGLDRGTFDAAIVGEPYLSAFRGKTLRVFANPYDAIAPQFLIANWFATADYVRNNSALVKRVVAVIYETARWANANRSDSGKILAKWDKLDPSSVAAMTRCEYALSLDPKYLDPVLAAMYKYDAVDRRLTSADIVAKLD